MTPAHGRRPAERDAVAELALVDESTDVAFQSTTTGVITWVSPNVTDVLGWDAANLVGTQAADLVHPEDLGVVAASREQIAMAGAVQTTRIRVRTVDGSYREMVGRGVVIVDAGGAPTGRLYALRDVHDESARRRALATLSQGNRVLVRATDEQELLEEMCRTVSDAGHYALAWYGRALDDVERTVAPMAVAGPASDYVGQVTVTWDESPTGLGPTGTAIRTGTTQVKDRLDEPDFQPWQQVAASLGFGSSISLPVVVDGEVDGALMVYAYEHGAFHDTAQTLLEDLAGDLGYGISRLRDAARLAGALSSSVYVLAAAVESRDPYTAGHQAHVGLLAGEVGRVLGLDEERVQGLVLGASIHDLGKISIAHDVLVKRGELTADEWELLKQHPETGFRITSRFPWPWPIAEMIHQHHERLDGSGYPLGLKGDQILLESRIIGVADLYEAMANDRPYRVAPGSGAALEVLANGRARTFDPDVVDALHAVLADGFFFPRD